jgi:hypothetical protein
MNQMRRMMNGAVALLGLVGACSFTGCVGAEAEDGDEQVDDVQQAEINPEVRVWLKVLIHAQDLANTPVATVYIFNQALGAYQTGTEYWFVNLNSISLLGTYGLSIVSTTSGTTTAPPDPAYASEQAFSLPNLSAWGTGWTTDPASGGSLYSGPSNKSLRLTTGVSGLSSIRWYQVIASTATPHNLTVNGLFTLGATSVSVPSGYKGYSISQSP